MSVKQDRTGVRTPAQLQQKYSFGKKFSEIIGLIDDSRDKVDSVESTLRGEIKTSEETTLARTSEMITAEAERITKVEGSVGQLKEVVGLEVSADGLTIEAKRLNTLEDSIDDLSSEVAMKIDADKVGIAIRAELVDGVDKVTTETGYVFDADGLTISKSGELMENKVDNTGMYVTRAGVDILTANHQGVTATNLYASTYLIIGAYGGRSRFEDYGANRTGCYWIGG